MRRLVLGTAGHIDHGKTTLVRALTGVDTDRLPDEKRRGITIDLGFASLALDDGTQLGIIDVPGHEGFIRNMLAGATGIDLVLLVVAADEGVMPQTREHLAIVQLLGVRGGVVAVTKADLVEREWLELVLEDLRGALAETPFAQAPLLPVSGVTGSGLDELRAALAAAAGEVEERTHEDLFRLPIDRVFTVRGTGTVVTGTVWSGVVRKEQTLRVLPGGGAARVRGVQVHGAERDEARAGTRVALALAGVDREQLTRGDVLVHGAWEPSHMLTVEVALLSDTSWRLKQRQRVRVHLGTAEILARAVLLDRMELGPGERAWAQLRLEAPLVARAGDRFVLRSYSPVTTIGGGMVAEPVAPKRRRLRSGEAEALEALRTGSAAEGLAARVRLAGWQGVAVDRLPLETHATPAAALAAVEAAEGGVVIRIGDAVFDAALVAQARERLLEAVEAFHTSSPLRPGIDREELRRTLPARSAPELVEWALDGLLREGVVEAREGVVARAGFVPRLTPEQEALRARLLDVLASGELAPPTLADLPSEVRERPELRPILRLLEQDGRIVAVSQELYLARPVLEAAVAALRQRLGGREDLSPADFKEVLPLTRKYLIPLLEHFDRTGVTVRRGDARSVVPA